MNLIQRVVSLFLLILLLFLIFVGINEYKERREGERLRVELNNVYLVILDKFIQIKTVPALKYLQDISLWDESVEFMNKRNRDYLVDNIDLSGDVYDIGETWVYTADFKKIYYYSNSNIASKAGDLEPVLPAIISRFNRERFYSFFYRKGEDIFEINAASIHSNSDRERRKDPAGYIFTAIPYDLSFIRQVKFESPLISKIEIIADRHSPADEPYVLHINKPLPDISGNPVAYIHVSLLSQYMRDLNTANRVQRFFFYFLIVSVIISIAAFRYGIIRPVQELYRILYRHNYTPPPGSLKYVSPEFQRIIDLVNLNRNIELQLGEALEEAEEQRKTAEKATKTKSEFLANMSHEIRTPMAGVLGFSDMLLDITTDPAHKELASGIKTSAEAIMSIINDILDMSKIESGRFILLNEPFNISSFLDNFIWILRGFASERELDIRLENRITHCTTVSGDTKRLRQILLNLGSNAIKYTIEGEVVITAESAPAGEGEIELIITVRDTGIGMNEEQLSKLFRQYEQVHDPASFSGGTGLGLAITKSLVNVMGGTLDVASEPGKGSTFTLKLKMKCVEGESPKPSLINAKKLGLKILLAEDNPISMKVIENIVGKAGCTFESAFNGQEVLELADSEKFDLILMDFHMPALSGIEAAEIIRQGSGPNRETPIYGISADLIERSIEYSGRAGMNGYLMKPFIIEEVYKILMKIRDGKDKA